MDPLSLPLDCLISVFTFLDEDDLITASYVCKEWHEAAETPWLWRELCLHRWGFCNLSQLLSDADRYTWKRYYLRRSSLEMSMKSGRSGGDYTCKSLKGHKGRVISIAYLVENNTIQNSWNSAPIVCSASSDGTVKAWDIHKGVNLWSSSGQNPLTAMFTDPQQCVVGAADSTGTIKLWKGKTGEELASYSSGSSQSTLLFFSMDRSSFLMVGTALGSLLALSSPLLSEVSRHVVCDSFRLNVLLSSPDKKWILTASKESSDFSPKVFWSQSVCCPVKDEDTVCLNLPVSGCSAAVFLPSQPARLAVIHSEGLGNQKALTVFDLSLKKSKYKEEPQAQQVESFKLDLSHSHSDMILQAKGNSTILVTDGNDLKVYTLKGALIANFKDHLQPIVSLCVDNFRVVTASRDLSLRVLTWRNDRDKGLTLESQYHLLGGSHTMSRGFTQVTCDYASIVASVESVDGKDALKAYVFNS
ncbi:F-box/WD repeat-containing protein 12 [Pygocentrus nattereri]|uniref:F-box/WD repeat-containing protein 12 n=1 Tax=Pygocentrus nattereri TaxID=42514 RepID=UPI000814266C|nr:F-box/WD repeat-containing protein 12 [Pygocentrus nattereri]